ncbi:c-type cytochrome [Salinisphaera aquimarina]|uniref:C-type cytochrome n=1 Tax=Salinisphaera aquimarina TaxID=2094031 RepID=A0ABV7EWQ0_9GAMM
MKVWKTVLATLVVSGLVIGLAAAGVVYSGAYNVGANAKHWPITHWVLTAAVHHSVEQHAADIKAPELGSEQQLLAGAANFDAMCSGCHEPPGAKPSVAAQGMYPRPPNLAHAGKEMSPGEIYWVIKNGIKASGMPAWGASHGDEEMWAMTAFIQQLPDMSKTDYDRLLMTAKADGIGHHDGESHEDGHGDAGHDDGDEHADGGHNENPSQSDSHDDAHAHG